MTTVPTRPASPTTPASWTEANQAYLEAELRRVRTLLEAHAAGTAPPRSKDGARTETEIEGWQRPPALVALTAAFGLTGFERDVLLLAAGGELDGTFAAVLASALRRPEGPGPERRGACFGLALEALPEAHWSALSPDRPLRRWRMVEIAGDSLTVGALRIDERILHYLVGVDYLDERLRGWVEPIDTSDELTPTQSELAARAAAVWAHASGSGEALPILALTGRDRSARRAVAAAACTELGLGLHLLHGEALPAGAAELEGLARLWEREAALAGSALYLELDHLEDGEAQREDAARRLVDLLRAPLFVASRERRRPGLRPAVSFEVPRPSPGEQLELWHRSLGAGTAAGIDAELAALVSQFRLGQAAVRAASEEALGVTGEEGSGPRLAGALWHACRRQARPSLGNLAQRIDALATWDDLVLPERHRSALREIAVHVRQQRRVYEEWGFGARSNRGLGVAALFAGISGTGKTMAAEVLANELDLDLYRIDLSSVISKYIGETEKNLQQVFDGAEDGGAILLFDEADALFGKRSEVKDSHDRYANIEVSYLLQRMEAYRGLAVLTTNRKSALDEAFLRRLRFVIEFPFPDAAGRAEIWRRIYPQATPTRDLDPERLARLAVAGGNIRNIALGAAFRAAEADRPVTMEDILEAARTEYLKLERPLSEAEIRGWSH